MKKSLLALAISALAFLSVPSPSQAAEILLVSDNAFAAPPNEGRTGDPEAPFVSFLQSLGHTVVRGTGAGSTAQFRGDGGPAAAQSVINSQGIDLVIVSRVTDSGSYSETTTATTGTRRTGWNNLNVPLMMMGAHLARDNRWRWVATQTLDEAVVTPPITDLVFTDPNHPFVVGRGTNLIDAGDNRSITRLGVPSTSAGNANVVATLSDTDLAILEWDAGEEFYAGSGQFAGAKRVLFPGLRYHESVDIDGAGTGVGDPVEFEDLSDNGKAILGQTINALVVPEPGTITVLVLGAATGLLRRRRSH